MFIVTAIFPLMMLILSIVNLLPGALVTIASWFVFTELFAFFVQKFYKSSALYGSLAALFLAMLWLRIIVLILFAGGALNKTLEDEVRHSPDCKSKKVFEKRDTPLTINDQKPPL